MCRQVSGEPDTVGGVERSVFLATVGLRRQVLAHQYSIETKEVALVNSGTPLFASVLETSVPRSVDLSLYPFGMLHLQSLQRHLAGGGGRGKISQR